MSPEPRYVQIQPDELDRIAEECSLTDAEERALVRFTGLAGYRTGEVSPITREATAEHLRWSKHKTIRVMDRLAECGLVVSKFTRGHGGWIAVLAYPQLVHLKRTSNAGRIEANLEERLAEYAEDRLAGGASSCQEQTSDRHTFSPELGGSLKPARDLCRFCPVRADCQALGVHDKGLQGVWGGLTQAERRTVRRGVA